MELREFVKQAIIEAYNGIEAARKEDDALNSAINKDLQIKPVDLKVKVGLSAHGDALQAGDSESTSSLEFNLRLDLPSLD